MRDGFEGRDDDPHRRPGADRDEELDVVRQDALPEQRPQAENGGRRARHRVGGGPADGQSELREAGVRVLGPGEELVRAHAADQVVVTLTAEEDVVIGGVTRPAVAPQPVVAAEAEQHVVVAPAVQAVAARGPHEEVVAGPAVEDRDEVVAARDEPRDVHGVGPDDERDLVVAAEAGDPELLHERGPQPVAPDGGHVPIDVGARERMVHDVDVHERHGALGGKRVAELVLGKVQLAVGDRVQPADHERGLTAEAVRAEADAVAHTLGAHEAAVEAGVLQRAVQVDNQVVDGIVGRGAAHRDREDARRDVAEGQRERGRTAQPSVAGHVRHPREHHVLFGELDRVSVVGALDHEDVGRLVVRHVALGLVAEVPVQRVAEDGVARTGIEDQEVDAFAAIEGVVPVLALEPVGVGATEQHVVAAAAQELVLAGAAIDLVGAADGVRLGVAGVERPGVVVAVDELVAVLAEDHVAAQVAVEPVAARAAVQLVTAKRELPGPERGVVEEPVIGVGVEEIDAFAAPEPLARLVPSGCESVERILGRVRRDQLAGVAEQEVGAAVAVELIDALVTDQRRGADRILVVAVEDIVVPAAADDVVAAFAVHLVTPEPAVEIIRAATTEQLVAAAPTEDEVGPAVTVQLVVERARVAGVVGNDLVAAAIDRQAVEPDRSDDRWVEAGRVQRLRVVPVDGIREIVRDAQIEERGRTILEPAPDDVVAVPAVDDVVPEAADQEVVTLGAKDAVVVRAADDRHAGARGARVDEVAARVAEGDPVRRRHARRPAVPRAVP